MHDSGMTHKARPSIVDIHYTAPEVLINNEEFSPSCDMWSMGIVFYEMLHGKVPWTGYDTDNLYDNIKNKELEFKPGLKSTIKDLISKMLTVDPNARISWKDIMQHPIFANPHDLLFYHPKNESKYEQVKLTMMSYLQEYLFRGYLIIDINAQIDFAPNE
jgi:serine/threonine protein kinase